MADDFGKQIAKLEEEMLARMVVVGIHVKGDFPDVEACVLTDLMLYLLPVVLL